MPRPQDTLRYAQGESPAGYMSGERQISGEESKAPRAGARGAVIDA